MSLRQRRYIEEGRRGGVDRNKAAKRANKIDDNMDQKNANAFLNISYQAVNNFPSGLHDKMRGLESQKRMLDAMMWKGYTDELVGSMREVQERISQLTIVQAALSRVAAGKVKRY